MAIKTTYAIHARVYTKVCATCCHPSPSRTVLRAAPHGDFLVLRRLWGRGFQNLALYTAYERTITQKPPWGRWRH